MIVNLSDFNDGGATDKIYFLDEIVFLIDIVFNCFLEFKDKD